MSDDHSFNVLMANADAVKRGALPIWTVYDRPTDYPDGFIARRFEVNALGPPTPTADRLIGGLDEIRLAFYRAGLTRLPRRSGDEAKIVESWI
jgi:hypothetical protein